MKSKLLSLGLLSVFAFALFSGVPDTAFAQGFAYKPLESIPGAAGATTFPQYVEGIYKFGIWTVGIAALFMLSVGGFIYMTSGGNTATLSRAKSYIADALIGLVLALLAYLILNVINPDLVNLNLSKFGEVGGVVAPATATTPVVKATVTPTANETLANRTSITDATYPNTWFPDAAQSAMVAALKPYGVIVKSGSGIGEAALCITEGQAASCTSLYGFPSSAADVMKILGDQCRTFNGGNWCTIAITGGTEYWKHSATTRHMPGNPVIDIGKNSSSASFFNYLKSVKPNPTCQRAGRNVYTIPVATGAGTKYVYLWDEDSVHWHVNINIDMCY